MDRERQIEIEEKFSAEAYEKFLEEENKKKTTEGMSTSLNSLLKRALPYYADKKVFDREVLKSRALTEETIAYYNELLNYMSREAILIIACKTVLNSHFMQGSPGKTIKRQNVKNISDSIFKTLQAEYEWAIFKKGVKARTVKAIVKNTSRTKTSKHKRDLLKTWVARYLDPATEKHEVTVEIKQLMRPLLDILAKITPPIGKDKAPCVLFEQKTVFTEKNKESVLFKPTDSLLDYVTSFEDRMQQQVTRFVPMVIPPLDWKLGDHRSGGYITPICKYEIIHTQERSCKVSQPVLDAVNNIQKTPWRVNKRVFEVMKTVFETTGEEDQDMFVGDVPNKSCVLFDKKYTELVREYNAELFEDRHKKMSHYVPTEIHKHWPTREHFSKTDDLEGWKSSPKYIWNKAKQENEWLRDQHSSFVLNLGNQLRIASEFKDYDQIYFPQFLDWRGRIYATPVFLSPQSDSKGKSLLEFAEGEPIGHHGVKWLAIHGCNAYGKQEVTLNFDRLPESLRAQVPLAEAFLQTSTYTYALDKLPMEEREAWVYRHEEEILKSAKDPKGHDFWKQAEDPFGFLAFCFEWADYCDSGKSPEYVSHLPVAMDATCSGLQHFSALMKDEVGGTQVNLIPSSKPNDIYKTVAEVTKRKHQEFINDPSKFLDKSDFKCLIKKYSLVELKQLARLWKTEDIDRSLCKTPTMTTSYNVTISGITDQIKEMVKKGKKDITLDVNSKDPVVASKVWYACRLISCLIKESVFEVVKSARDAQDILGDIASKITGDRKIVRWVTPMGLEVIQSYKKFSTKQINLFLAGVRLRLSVADRHKFSVNSSKSKAGLAPNFIHSLDACHLQMTVNACVNKAGLTNFAFIHDSFGTHASKTDLMMRILREEFVRLYSQDILKQALAQWKEFYPNVKFNEIPEEAFGTLNVNCVKDSKYFFS